MGGVALDDVTDVLNDGMDGVPFLQVLKEPAVGEGRRREGEEEKRTGGGEGEERRRGGEEKDRRRRGREEERKRGGEEDRKRRRTGGGKGEGREEKKRRGREEERGRGETQTSSSLRDRTIMHLVDVYTCTQRCPLVIRLAKTH